MATPSAGHEFTTITRHSSELRLAVLKDLADISLRLLGSSPPILTSDNVAVVTNPVVDAPSRATELVKFIITKVEEDPRCYHVLVQVLEEANTEYYEIILGKLSETFANLQLQDPPPGEAQSGTGKKECSTASGNGCAVKEEAQVRGDISGAHAYQRYYNSHMYLGMQPD